MVVAILEVRRVATSPGLAERLAGLGRSSEAELVQAAQTCASEEELLRLLGRQAS